MRTHRAGRGADLNEHAEAEQKRREPRNERADQVEQLGADRPTAQRRAAAKGDDERCCEQAAEPSHKHTSRRALA